MLPRLYASLWPLLLALLLAGCLPSSCSRTESRSLLPADSLSRALAETFPVDTLALVWSSVGTDAHPLAYPRTVLFDAGGGLYVSDGERNSLFRFAGDGILLDEITHDSLAYPYLAGLRGDTVVVFNPEARRFDFMVGNRPVHHLHVPEGLPEHGLYQYVAADAGALYYKAIAEDFEGFVARLGDDGAVVEKTLLGGPHWRQAGMLRLWGGDLLSLCFYRPVIDVLTPGGTRDTLALTGFDSPNLNRSRLFALGEVHQPPMLSAAAAAAGDLLFVMNMRPGWLRLDAYDRAGHLQHVLTQPDPSFNKDFFPIDLTARAVGDGRYEIAVVVVHPEPQVHLYHWTRPTTPARGEL